MIQKKDFVCVREAKTVEDIVLQNKQKGGNVTVFTFSYGFFGKT